MDNTPLAALSHHLHLHLHLHLETRFPSLAIELHHRRLCHCLPSLLNLVPLSLRAGRPVNFQSIPLRPRTCVAPVSLRRPRACTKHKAQSRKQKAESSSGSSSATRHFCSTSQPGQLARARPLVLPTTQSIDRAFPRCVCHLAYFTSPQRIAPVPAARVFCFAVELIGASNLDMAAMEEIEALLQSLQTLKAPGVTPSKINAITAKCVDNVQVCRLCGLCSYLTWSPY